MEEYNNIQVKKDSYECSITVDISVFGFQDDELKILLVKRLDTDFKGFWLLPGGAMFENETIEDCAKKVLFELTGMTDIHYQQVKCYSEVNRHPVKRVVTILFFALIKPENHPVFIKHPISEIEWFPITNIPSKIGFDHEQLFKDAFEYLRNNIRTKLIFGELLPEKFTLLEVQNLYESILNEKLDRRNFRKKLQQLDIIENTGEKKIGVKGGPFLYKMK